MGIMSYRMVEALRSRAPLILIAEIDHPSGTARFWSGVGTLSWNSYSWTGSGTLGAITPIKHSTDIAIQEIEFVLAGVDQAVVATLASDVRNRSGKAWLACLNAQGLVVPDPIQVVDAELDFQSHKISEDGTSIISITARTGFYTLERSLNDVWSAEDQRKKFSYESPFTPDTGLDLISKLQNQELSWGPA